MISYIVVLSGFNHRPHRFQSIMTTQFCFQLGLYLYDQSHHCPVQFLSQIVLGSISHDSSISFSTQTRLILSVTSLSYHVFITNYTPSNRSRQFSFVFGIDHTYKIYHIIVLFNFNHIQHLVLSIMKAHFHFQFRSYLYDRSQRCSIRLITSLSYLVFIIDGTQSN